MDIHEQMQQIYQEMSLEDIPWNLADPPRLLVNAVETGQIKPCKAVDLGCGAGNYAVWLASKGFDVTGLDISEKAIEHAAALATRKGVSCDFAAVDLLGDVEEYHERFDFAYDWELLHHIFPDDRMKYVKNVHGMLRPGGTYYSVCFSEKDHAFGGRGKFRDTSIGTRLYFSSEDELRQLFSPFFEVTELSTIKIVGKRGPHFVNAAWMKRA